MGWLSVGDNSHALSLQMQMQRVPRSELEELRQKKNEIEPVGHKYYDSLPPVYNQLTELHGIRQSNEVGTHEAEVGMADLSINAALVISKDDEPSRLIELNDDQRRKKPKSSASGNEDFPSRYYRGAARDRPPHQEHPKTLYRVSDWHMMITSTACT